MANRLVLHFPGSSITIVSDDGMDVIEALSNFCKKELGAYHSTEAINELTMDALSPEQSNELHSLMFELGIF